MANDYNEILQRKLGPALIDTVFYKQSGLDQLFQIFGTQAPRSGDRITESFRAANSSNNAAYDKSAVDVVAGSQTLIKPYWNKKFYNGASEVYGIDKANNTMGDIAIDLAADALAVELKSMAGTIFDAFWTRALADVDSSATAYSDASLSRSTYASLASYEETNNTAITVALVRGMINGSTISKNVDRNDYVIIMEEAVYNKFSPLAAATHTFNQNGDISMSGRDYGYAPTATFDGIPIYSMKGMTTGDVYFLRRQDVKIVENMPMRLELKNSERDTDLTQIYYGVTPYIINPGFQGKMLTKD